MDGYVDAKKEPIKQIALDYSFITIDVEKTNLVTIDV